jgi:hypothetical protein
VEISRSGQLYALSPTNDPNRWESLQAYNSFQDVVVQSEARLGFLQSVVSLGDEANDRKYLYVTNPTNAIHHMIMHPL